METDRSEPSPRSSNFHPVTLETVITTLNLSLTVYNTITFLNFCVD